MNLSSIIILQFSYNLVINIKLTKNTLDILCKMWYN